MIMATILIFPSKFPNFVRHTVYLQAKYIKLLPHATLPFLSVWQNNEHGDAKGSSPNYSYCSWRKLQICHSGSTGNCSHLVMRSLRWVCTRDLQLVGNSAVGAYDNRQFRTLFPLCCATTIYCNNTSGLRCNCFLKSSICKMWYFL